MGGGCQERDRGVPLLRDGKEDVEEPKEWSVMEVCGGGGVLRVVGGFLVGNFSVEEVWQPMLWAHRMAVTRWNKHR